MEPGHLPGRGFQAEEAIVVDVDVPEEGRRHAEDVRKVAEEPARQVDEVGPLVDEFAAAGDLALAAPFLVVARPPAVAVAAADVEQRAEVARVDDGAGPQHGGVEAVVEAHLDDRAVAFGGGDHGVEVGGGARGRLLDHGVLAGFRGRQCDRCQHVMRGGDHHGVDVGLDHVLPLSGRARARAEAGERGGPASVDVGHHRHLMALRHGRFGPFLADQATANDADLHAALHHFWLLSSGTIRRSV